MAYKDIKEFIGSDLHKEMIDTQNKIMKATFEEAKMLGFSDKEALQIVKDEMIMKISELGGEKESNTN